MGARRIMFPGVMVLAMVLFSAAPSVADMEKPADAHMKMHHLHIMMNHGLGMVTEGSTLVMIADMKMSAGMDALTREHGVKMINSGRDVISGSLSGDDMEMMHKEGMGPKDDPAMQASHDLGEAILKYADTLGKMKMESMSGSMMDMHHMHLLINHAVEMAAEGSNMAMLADMEMAGQVDRMSRDHGKLMIAEAKSVIAAVTESKAMTGMHKEGKGPDKDPMMGQTHELIEQALKIIDLLEKM